FPCQGRPCGCASAADCWQGDCCCFTLAEKVAWADAHGVEPPAHARERAAACCSHGSCCSEPTPGCRACAARARSAPAVIPTLFAARCGGGRAQVGLLGIEPGLVPAPPAVVPGPPTAAAPRVFLDRFTSVNHAPAIPPPRSSRPDC